MIPAETRRLFNIREGDGLIVSVDGENITIHKLDSTCTFCGSTEQVSSFYAKGICTACSEELTAHN